MIFVFRQFCASYFYELVLCFDSAHWKILITGNIRILELGYDSHGL